VLQAAFENDLVNELEYYTLINSTLTDSDRETFLTKTANKSAILAVEFVRYLQSKGKLKEAISTLSNVQKSTCNFAFF
jgi:hypothetical protein